MISIIIVNWNSGRQLRECVASINKYNQGLVKHTVVVDNGSVDDSCNSVQDFSNVTLLRVGKNLGFGKACNFGAQHVDSEYVLFLNPDAVLFANTLPHVFAYMQEPVNAQTGICGVMLLDEGGHISRCCARFPSALGFSAQAIGLDKIYPSIGHFMKEWNHEQTRKVDQVIGAFFLVRHKLFNALDGFDERFFLYFEEVDFSLRADQIGWRSMYIAEAQAFHFGNGTSNQVKSHRLFYSLRSRLLYSIKHFSLTGTFIVFFITLFVEPITRLFFALMRHSWPSLTETFNAYVMLWRWLPKWVLKGEMR